MTPTQSASGDADVARASQLQHMVEHVDGHGHLGGPTLVRMRASPIGIVTETCHWTGVDPGRDWLRRRRSRFATLVTPRPGRREGDGRI